MSTYVRLGSKPTRLGLDMPEVPGAWKETSGRLAPGAPVSTCAGVSAEAMGRTLNVRALRLVSPAFTPGPRSGLATSAPRNRNRVVLGKVVYVRVETGGRRMPK